MYCIYIPEREKYIKNFFNNLGLKINYIKNKKIKLYVSNYYLFKQNRENLGSNLDNLVIKNHDCYNL